MSELKPDVRTAREFPPLSRVVLASDYDAMAQRCRELERFMSEPLKKLVQERDTLRAEVERLNIHVEKAQQHALTMGNKALELAAREIELQVEVEALREIREIASQCAANGGYLCSRDLIELRELLKK